MKTCSTLFCLGLLLFNSLALAGVPPGTPEVPWSPQYPGAPGPGGSCTLSETWAPSDDFYLNSDSNAFVRGMAAGASAVFAAGEVTVQSSSGPVHAWAVRRSLDGGVTWQSVDMYALEGGSPATALAIATDGDQTVYAVGRALKLIQLPGSFAEHWIVRKSTDNGQTWSTVQDRTDFGSASGVALDRTGRVYVTGYGDVSATNTMTLMTERSDDGGATWSVLETFDNLPGGNGAESRSIVVGPSGDVFVAGVAFDNLSRAFWIVRHSPSGAAGTWTTVDSYHLSLTSDAQALAGTVDPHGNVVFTGSEHDATNQHWITRAASAAAPASWTTIDDFNAGPFLFAVGAAGVTFGPKGELYVTGGIRGTNGSFYYQTRRGSLQAGSFSLFDSVSGTDAVPGVSTSGLAAVVTPDGSVFTGGGLYDPANGLVWLVRKLGCDTYGGTFK